MTLPRVLLKPRRARPFYGRHPWVYPGAIESVEGNPADGDVVDLCSHTGNFVARGLYNALFVNAADEADLAPLSEANGSFDCDGNLGGETVGGHGWEYTEERPLTLLSGSSP